MLTTDGLPSTPHFAVAPRATPRSPLDDYVDLGELIEEHGESFVLLPAQWPSPRNPLIRSGEALLLKRFFLLGLDDLGRWLAWRQRTDAPPPAPIQAAFLDALAWLAERDDDWPFSFVAVCSYLRLPAEKIRAKFLTDIRAALAAREEDDPW